MLSKVVAPNTGKMPETIPMVMEKAIFSGVSPSAGTKRNGMSILFLNDSAIFKTVY
jgi:hypothetical protein